MDRSSYIIHDIREREREREREWERTVFQQCRGNSGLRCGPGSKESSCQCRRPGFDPWVGKISWRRERLPTPVFLPCAEEPGGVQLVGLQRIGHGWATHTHTHTHTHQREQLIDTFTFTLWHIMQAFQLFTRWVEIYGKLCDIMIYKLRKIFITHG